MTAWTINPIFNGATAWAVSLVEFLVLGLSFYWAAQAALSRTRSARRLALFTLRLLVILMLIAAILRPTLVTTKSHPQPATIAILLDRSRSMLVEDAFGGKSRWESLKSTLKDAMPALADLPGSLEIKIYAFDAQTTPLDFSQGKLDLGSPPTGTMTAIGAALEQVRKENSGKRLAGVILLSDGAQQAYAPYNAMPQDAARRLAEIGCPLYTVAFGQAGAAGQGRDVAVKSIPDDLDIFVKNILDVTGIVRVAGLANQNIPVELLYETTPGKMESVVRTVLKADSDDASLPLQMTYIPQEAGERKLTIRAEVQAGELVTTNNELSTFVNVRKGGLNVLYLEGEPRVEQRFLRRSLNASPDIKVDYEWYDHRNRKNWPVNVGDRFNPGKYDVYILGDLDASAFRPDDLKRLAKTVQDGAGLMMLGGFHSFWGGGYMDTPLADVLPLAQDRGSARLRRQPFDEPLRSDLQLIGPQRVRPTPNFGNAPFVALGPPDKNAQLWAELPPLEGANNLMELKDNAKVILENQQQKPLLVTNELRVGRVIAFAGDSTWHWWMQGYEAQHKRFWRQLVLWLARKDADEHSVWIRFDKRRFGLGEKVEFSCGVKTVQGDPIPGATLEAEVVLPDGSKRPVKLAGKGETNLGTFSDTQASGDYTVVVTAKQGPALLGAQRARFVTFEQDLELEDPAARPSLMSALSKMTESSGGKTVAPEQLAELLRQIKEHPPTLEVEYETKQTPWDTPEFFLIFVALLTAEWFLRKRWGLV